MKVWRPRSFVGWLLTAFLVGVIILTAGPILYARFVTDDDWPRPPDLRPATERLEEQLRDIKDEIARLREQGHARDAGVLSQKLIKVQQWLRVPYSPPRSDEPEVHVVGLYRYLRARGPLPRAFCDGKQEVDVTDTSSPIILVLSSVCEGKRRTEWTIHLADGVRLHRVIVAGDDDQTVGQIPSDLAVLNLGKERSPDNFRLGRLALEMGDMVEKVEHLTGHRPMTIQVREAHGDEPFVIGPSNLDWRAQHVLGRINPLHRRTTGNARKRQLAAMRGLEFDGVVYTASGLSVLTRLNPLGPVSGVLRPLMVDQDVVWAGVLSSRIAFGTAKPLRGSSPSSPIVDPEGPRYFSLGPFDRPTEIIPYPFQERPLPPIEGDPHITFKSLTLDQRRQRLLIADSRRVYVYPLLVWPDSLARWSVLAELPSNGYTQALAYCNQDDVWYALGNETIYEFGPQGEFRRKQSLSLPLLRDGRYGSIHQFTCVRDQLVLLTRALPGSDNPRESFDREQVLGRRSLYSHYCFVINPSSGSVLPTDVSLIWLAVSTLSAKNFGVLLGVIAAAAYLSLATALWVLWRRSARLQARAAARIRSQADELERKVRALRGAANGLDHDVVQRLIWVAEWLRNARDGKGDSGKLIERALDAMSEAQGDAAKRVEILNQEVSPERISVPTVLEHVRSEALQIPRIPLSGPVDIQIRSEEHVTNDAGDVNVVLPIIKSALANLVRNAINHGAVVGEALLIALDYEYAQDGVRIWVSDNGRGIRREDWPRVFDLGWKGPDSSGTGRGLYIARQALEQHGGELRLVGSRLNRGTTFELWLPRANGEQRGKDQGQGGASQMAGPWCRLRQRFGCRTAGRQWSQQRE